MKSVKVSGTVFGQIQAPKMQLNSKPHFETLWKYKKFQLHWTVTYINNFNMGNF